MNRKRFVLPMLGTLLGGGLILLVSLLSRADLCAQVFSGKPELDRSKPVPAKAEVVCEYLVVFEQNLIADINIDFAEDKQWGWIPSGWNITQMLDDGSMRLLSEAKVTSYSINQPIKIEEFH